MLFSVMQFLPFTLGMALIVVLRNHFRYSEFGSVIVQLPYMMALAILLETILMLLFLHRREGGK